MSSPHAKYFPGHASQHWGKSFTICETLGSTDLGFVKGGGLTGRLRSIRLQSKPSPPFHLEMCITFDGERTLLSLAGDYSVFKHKQIYVPFV